MFALYVLGVVGAFVVALVLRRTVTKGQSSGFMMEMPKYQMPRVRDVAIGLWSRAEIFLKRAGTTIALTTVVLWALLSFPKPLERSARRRRSAIRSRAASPTAIEPAFRPIGFNRDIVLALIPAMAAREVAVAALGTVYAIDARGGEADDSRIGATLKSRWSLPTALAFLMWFVFAPQCISTIAVTRRETNGWKWPRSWLAICSPLPISRQASHTGSRSPRASSEGSEQWQAASTRSSSSAISGKDPESRSFQNGGKVVNLRIATSESWKDRNSGERKEKTEWHSVAIFNEGLANVAEKYLRKGSKVYIEGAAADAQMAGPVGRRQIFDRDRAAGVQ